MLLAQAHSFRQQARLAITLAWVAGYTNIITVLMCGTVTSHLSGTTSSLARDLVSGRWLLALFAFALIASFLIGATLAGACSEFARRAGWAAIYVLPMGMEAAMLGVVALLLDVNGIAMISPEAAGFRETPVIWTIACFAALAMGLQNATITRISGGVVRTTHVTGVVTDVGLELAQLFYSAWDARRAATETPRHLLNRAKAHPSLLRLALLASIVGSFALGAALGTLAHDRFLSYAMFPPVIFLLWIIYQDITRPIAAIVQSERLPIGSDESGPTYLEVFHIRRQGGKEKPHGLPNLLQWAASLSSDTQIVVLDFGRDARISRGAVAELQAIYLQMRNRGKKLIFSGLRDDVYESIVGQWGDDLRDSMVVPDLARVLGRLSQGE